MAALALALAAAACNASTASSVNDSAIRSPAPAVAATPAPVPSSLYGHVVTRIPTASKIVALTFDGGSNAAGVSSILATLRAKHAAATFFLTGRFVTAFPVRSRYLAAWGRIGNHTVTHPHLTTLSDAAVGAQIANARAAIMTVTGEDPKPFFRFPFGEYDTRTLRIVNDRHWVAVGWTVDSRGWMGTANGNTVSAVVARVVAARTPGEIVLMHLGANPNDQSTLDAAALPAIIDRLRYYGYSFVTLYPLLH
jgi:peptidoglycan/xylan/chitin deacetylase (PgdA/CDA1 family)